MASVDTPDDQLVSVNYGDHEPDDWAAKHQISLSELASRLDAKTHYDNRGRIIWSDGAEVATLQWIPYLGGGGAIARSVLTAWRGAASAELSVGAFVADWAGVEKYFYSPLTGRYGAEIAWSINHAVMGQHEIVIDVGDGTNFYRGVIGYERVSGQYYYINAAGITVLLPQNPLIRADIHHWHKMKLVIDANTLMYARALFDGVEHDLSAHALRNMGAGAGPYIRVIITIFGHAANAQKMYIDDFILTHLEP